MNLTSDEGNGEEKDHCGAANVVKGAESSASFFRDRIENEVKRGAGETYDDSDGCDSH